jgi:hypothetical protein
MSLNILGNKNKREKEKRLKISEQKKKFFCAFFHVIKEDMQRAGNP